MSLTTSGREWTVLVAGEHTGGRFAVIETRERPGSEPPRHVHSREDEVVYVLEGRVTYYRDGERLDGPPGTLFYLPRGCEHTFSIETAEARLLVMVSPAGFEGCLRELIQPDEAGEERHDIERLVATAARYGVSITGPSRFPP